MDGRATIILDKLAIGYGTKRRGTAVVAHDISGSIFRGELTCLLGANGIGKSTLLKTLSAFLPKLEGRILLCGKDIDDYTDKELAKTVGVVLTTRPEVENMRVSELVGLGRSPYTGFWGRLSREDKEIVAHSIALVGVEPLADRMVDTLSDGERQKVMIAKALSQQTPIVFLDEPTAFLDFQSRVETLRLLKRLTRETGKTIFLSTHDVELALQVADKLWIMEAGGRWGEKVITHGSPAELARNGSLSRFIEGENITFDPETLRIRIRES